MPIAHLQMSYNNYLDADAAFSTVCDFPDPTCVVVKHTNPCGVASRDDLLEAYRLAVRADPISAFGGIVAFNRYVASSITRHMQTATDRHLIATASGIAPVAACWV